ncbi:AAA family ATPase [Salinicola sp. DM10]|uniref:AAA family ATPase n=1 Tax=Salinicola sp. DM10 TaxID=2815721 RepID=UPI001A8EDAFD|nr:AAA family ATPase [Salinicola sp. DM10]MCE3027286.1 AAA family ATPase [Salinicola sp. DM10]
MKIDFVEIKNFRKLQSCRIEFDDSVTLLVGANNSGKTSAMVAMRKFLLSPKSLEVRDISIGNWAEIDKIGIDWESGVESEYSINNFFPLLDVWLDAPLSQIHHVVDLIPSADWVGGAIGVRLSFEVKNLDELKAAYLEARTAARRIEQGAPEGHSPSVPPRNLIEFIEPVISKYLVLKAYSLDPELLTPPDSKGRAHVQDLPDDALEIGGTPLKNLINIREIPADREFSTGGTSSLGGEDVKAERLIRTLSEHVRSYYDAHVDKKEEVSADDISAFSSLQRAERAFDKRMKSGFASVFEELAELGIPGVNNPSIEINTKFKSLDGLSHGSAVQYRVSEPEDGQEVRYLPESYAGLGYQNLIAMVFLLMRFRQDWIDPKVGNAEEGSIAPLQLVMIEEPEAHLHAQVQQVFIKKSYSVLRNHSDLGDSSENMTQLLVSTHSSHVAHEVNFSNLRYFRRLPAEAKGQPPISTIVNLSNVFGEDDKTLRFVKRYIKATDCDLFFADGAIFVEGQAERILVPHFIRHHFGDLWRRYISMIDLGGSNAPRFKPLVKALGLTSLVITDLDAGVPTTVPKKGGGTTTRTKKAKPAIGADQVTTNPTLKEWHPKIAKIDELIALEDSDHAVCVDDEYELYVSYQKKVKNPIDDDEELIPRTFEDALVYANFSVLEGVSGSSTTNKVSALVKSELSGAELEAELFEIVDSAEKAAFAIDCLAAMEDGAELVPPFYIAAGLEWLQEKLTDPSLVKEEAEEIENG